MGRPLSANAPVSRGHKGLTAAQSRLRSHPRLTLAGVVIATAAIAVIDWATGPDVVFSVFYLLPVSAVAWTVGARGWLVTICAWAATAWITADIANGHHYGSWIVPAWNTVARFATLLVVAVLVSELDRVVEHERVLARSDVLTGVGNRRWFYEQACDVLARRPAGGVTVVHLDVDNLKQINDNLGHVAGDRALAAVGAALRTSVRETDVVARVGGDEFTLLVSSGIGVDPAGTVSSLIERINASLRAASIDVQVSAGAVSFDAPSESLDAAVIAADKLLYAVKTSGKGGYRWAALGSDTASSLSDSGDAQLAQA
jgi:diguanylate cyclase (GGDEF)-like protein